jgi:hypothetical protein
VFRIRDILKLIGSLGLYSGLRIQDRALFNSGFQDANNISFFPQFFCMFLLTVGSYLNFKHNLPLEVNRTVKMMVYLNFLLVDSVMIEGSRSEQIIPDTDPRLKNIRYGSGTLL